MRMFALHKGCNYLFLVSFVCAIFVSQRADTQTWSTVFDVTSPSVSMYSLHQSSIFSSSGFGLFGRYGSSFKIYHSSGNNFVDTTSGVQPYPSPGFWGGMLTTNAYNFFSIRQSEEGLVYLAVTMPAMDSNYNVINTGLRVYKRNTDGWQQIGPDNISSSEDGDHCALVHLGFVDDVVPMLLWTYKSSNCENLFAARWDTTAWQPMGAGATTEGQGIAGNSVLDPVLVVGPDKRPVAVYCDFSVASNPEIRALRWNGTIWEALGPDSGNVSQSANFSIQPSAIFDADGVLHVAWAEFVGVQDYPQAWWIERQTHGSGMTHYDGTDAVFQNLKSPRDMAGTYLDASTSWTQGQWIVKIRKYTNNQWVDVDFACPDFTPLVVGTVTSAHMLNPRLALVGKNILGLAWETWLVTGLFPFDAFSQFPNRIGFRYREKGVWKEVAAGDAVQGVTGDVSRRLRGLSAYGDTAFELAHEAGVLRSPGLITPSPQKSNSWNMLLFDK